MPKVKSCLKEGKGRVALADMDLPDPGPGQALVRTRLTTICGTDIHLVDEFEVIPAGTPMGHEAVGIVEAVGEGVERLKAGDRIVPSCLLSCGNCERCRSGEPQLCSTFNSPFNLLLGAQGEAFLLNGADHSAAVIPDGMDDRHALFASDVMSTGFGAIERAGLKQGQSVAIFAQGPVGLCATAAAAYYGAGTILAVESIPERIELAKKLGAHRIVAPDTAVEEIMQATTNLGVDVAVECLGKQVTFENCCQVVRLGGTVSSVGVYGGIEGLLLPTDGSFMHRSIVTTLCPTGTKRLEHLLRICDSGEVDLTPLFSHDRKLDELVELYDMFREHRDGVIKLAITT
jgi:threonine dehydrogenase-like Zn-dependent dehydrogenase